jgi:hypothetical protein
MDAAQAEHYQGLGLQNDYQIMSGQFLIPLAEDAPTDPEELAEWTPFVMVQAHAAYRLRRFQYSVTKHRNPPILPKPADTGAYKFLTGTVQLPHPSVQSDGSYTWTAATNYVFAEACVSNSDTGFVIGSTLDAFPNQINNQQYQTTADAMANVSESGTGPKSGYGLAKTLDTNSPHWSYGEPSYYPAELLSADLVIGPISYPSITL